MVLRDLSKIKSYLDVLNITIISDSNVYTSGMGDQKK